MITARPLVEDDLEAVVELLHAYDRRWFGEPVLPLEDVQAEWRTPPFDLATDSEGWFEEEDEGGALVAFGTLARAGIELAVRDGWDAAGLEAALLDRWEGEARRRGLDAVHRDLPADDVGSRALLEARGWTVERTGWLLGLSPDVAVGAPDLPDGYAVRPMTDDDLPAVFAVVRDAFAVYQATTRTFEQWRAGTVERPDVTVGHARVVVHAGRVVGACLLMDPPATGACEAWVPQLAVARAHRRRGLAGALLASTTLAARERGVAGLALYTHSGTGALGLYERFGMVVRHHLLECTLSL